MDIITYKLIHFIGLFLLMFSLGSLFTKYNKAAAAGHGIALILILLGGFGMQAKMHLGMPSWLIVKLVIWLIFGATVVLAKRKVLQGPIVYVMMVGLAAVAAYLGLYRPF